MKKQEAYEFMKSIMMMEFEETAVTGCTVRSSASMAPTPALPASVRQTASRKRRGGRSAKVAAAR